MGLSNDDVRALVNRAKLDGRPIRSNAIRDGDKIIRYLTDKKGNVKVVNRD